MTNPKSKFLSSILRKVFHNADYWVLIIFTLVVLVRISRGTWAMSGDPPHYLIITHSLIFDGDIDVANNYRDYTILPYLTTPLEQGKHAVVGAKGRTYSIHSTGMGVLLIPPYILSLLVARTLPNSYLKMFRYSPQLLIRDFISLYIVLFTLCLASLMLRDIQIFSEKSLHKSVATSIILFTCPVFPLSIFAFPEIPAALLLYLGCRKLFLYSAQLSLKSFFW